MIERLRAIIEQPGDCYHLGDCVVSTVRAALPALLAAAEALEWIAGRRPDPPVRTAITMEARARAALEAMAPRGEAK